MRNMYTHKESPTHDVYRDTHRTTDDVYRHTQPHSMYADTHTQIRIHIYMCNPKP
jgi:hypothetical protein